MPARRDHGHGGRSARAATVARDERHRAPDACAVLASARAAQCLAVSSTRARHLRRHDLTIALMRKLHAGVQLPQTGARAVPS